MRIWGNVRITTFQVIAFGFFALILTGTLLQVGRGERGGVQPLAGKVEIQPVVTDGKGG